MRLLRISIHGFKSFADKVTIDYKQGLITIAADVAEGKVTATYKAMHYGTPSWADFKGVQGAMYVLLKK